MRFLLILFLALPVKADPVKVEMALTISPYVLAIDNDKPFRTGGKILLTQLTAMGAYLAAHERTDAWALSAGTNAALLCNLENDTTCAIGLVAASYIVYSKYKTTEGSILGFGIGVASGALVPGIVANF
jgi:hypothetical protein